MLKRTALLLLCFGVVSVQALSNDTQLTGYKTRDHRNMGSPYVPLDSWVYPIFDKLIAMGYIDSANSADLPWSRMECARLVEEAKDKATGRERNIGQELLDTLAEEFSAELERRSGAANQELRLESASAALTDVAGTPLADSYHFGQTIINNSGRPYFEGVNDYLGLAARSVAGPFSFYFRGELQHAASIPAFSMEARRAIAAADNNPIQPAINVPPTNNFTLLESYFGFTVRNWQITAGKQNLWWGPYGRSSLLLSSNAEPFNMVRINRVSPFQLPSIFKRLGPIYYDSFFGQLAGHNFPPSPYTWGQKVTLKPTPNLELGFSRMAVFAGQGVTPLTWHTFINSFFSSRSQNKGTREDPGDRKSTVTLNYRLPGLRDQVTLYAEGLADDEPSPLASPRRSAWNSGIYISHLPRLKKVDLRLEAVYTDVPTSQSVGGKFIYWEIIYHDSHTNKGNLLGSWVGREGKGYQAITTYWLSSRNTVEIGYRNSQIASDFIPRGMSLHDAWTKADLQVRKDLSFSAFCQYEHVNEPVLGLNQASNFTTSLKITYWPSWKLH
jgi:hypothetical protein